MLSNDKHIERTCHGLRPSRTALSAAIATLLGLYGVGAFVPAHAQATTGTIFGSAPTSGATVQIIGGSGFSRTVPVDSSGHYSLTVPVGNYTVNLLEGGAVVQSHSNVSPVAGGASEVDFAKSGVNAQNLSTVTVTANRLPAIDVTSTTQNLTITAKQLTELPVARSAEAIALLAPGTVQGAAMFMGSGPTGGSPLSFGGSSIVENAYYINGFDTSDPLSNTGGVALPYGVIDQQQVLTSGYDAKYGRSTGGVISQIGKGGTNDWHFGGQVLWAPAFAQDSYDNYYYSNPYFTPAAAGANYQANEAAGQMFQPNKQAGTNQWNTVYDAYVSGPLIKDKLFFFLGAEVDKTQFNNVADNVTDGKVFSQRQSNPKVYAKLDWNINDSNTLSLTDIYNGYTRDPGYYYDYSYDNNQYTRGNSLGYDSLEQKNTFDVWIGKYTSYITDNLTLNVLYGKMSSKYYTAFGPDYDNDVPNIIAPSAQIGAPCSHGCTNSNILPQANNPNHTAETRNLRIDLDWKLGNHDIQFGIDNDNSVDRMDGLAMTGPGFESGNGYAWSYGAGYVAQYRFDTVSPSLVVRQRAQYLEDNWQVTPNLLLNLGVRDDEFTNFNPEGQAYLRLTKPQWAPRLGFSWDVFGDSTMKVFGNAGRYYLAMPAAVALREAAAPLYTLTYFTYTGVNADGTPQGVLPSQQGACAGNPSCVGPNGNVYIVNNENGSLLNPKAAVNANLKAEYQDQFVLGMQQQFTMFDQSWVYGVTGTVNKLGRIIDDFDPQAYAGMNGATDTVLLQLAKAQGVDINLAKLSGSTLINPGSAAVLTVPTTAGGWAQVRMPGADFGYPQAKRNYYSLELYLEHVFDGKWFGKIDYVFSRSYGTTEGPVSSNIGQGGSSQSATEQWDFSQIMSYSNGLLANDQKHQLRIYGSYKITPEWTVGAVYRIASGTPEDCLGWYGPEQTDYQNYAAVNTGGGAYHWCGGVPSTPGQLGFTPWTHQLDLQLDYRPAFAKNRLDFQLQVHNVFNEQNVTQITPYYGTSAYSAANNQPGPMPQFLAPFGMELPRYVQFGITYDY